MAVDIVPKVTEGLNWESLKILTSAELIERVLPIAREFLRQVFGQDVGDPVLQFLFLALAVEPLHFEVSPVGSLHNLALEIVFLFNVLIYLLNLLAIWRLH